MNFQEAVNSTWCKAALSANQVKYVSDQDVINLFNTLQIRHEMPLLYKSTMENIHGEFDESNAGWFDEFYKIVSNEIIGILTAEGTSWEELETYHFGLGRNLIILSKLAYEGLMRKDQVKDAVKILIKPTGIGLDFEDFMLRDGASLFEDQDNSALEAIINEAIAANPKAIEEYKSGKEKAIMSLVGFVMKKMKSDPKLVIDTIKQKIV